MASERTFLGAMLLLVAVGMTIMLYGVFLTSGQSVNAIMVAGGVVTVLPIAAMVYYTAGLSEPADESHA